VVFSILLLGDAFYRWDGARYYITFYEFIPSAALVTILWTVVAAWSLTTLESLSRRMGRFISGEHLLVFVGIFLLVVSNAWSFKRLIPEYKYSLPFIFQYGVYGGSALLALLTVAIFRKKIHVISGAISPLVWVFGIWFLVSLPLVAYHTWGKGSYVAVSNENAQSASSEDTRPNILLVTFDALTARHMSVYGYDRPTTPFISEWTKEASLFKRAEAEGTWTKSTIASLLTGKRVWSHLVFHPHASKINRGVTENLPLLLKKNGYINISLPSNYFGAPVSFNMSPFFDIEYPLGVFRSRTSFLESLDNAIHDLFAGKIRLYQWFTQDDFIFKHFWKKFVKIKGKGVFKAVTIWPLDIAHNKFLEEVDNGLKEPFFAWIHHYPPHDPFLPPKPYMGMFDRSMKFRTEKSQSEAIYVKYRNRNQPDDFQSDIDTLISRYDEFIAYCDKEFQDFIVQLEKRDILKNTVIIFSSDHGESFEHDWTGHGGPHLHEAITNIPLIIKEPGQSKGAVINNIVEQVDITATILDYAKVPVPSWMEGRSLVPLMRGEQLQPRPAFSMSFQGNESGKQLTTGAIAVWEGDYKLIHNISSGNSTLFHLKDDPDEMDNIYTEEPEIGQRLLSYIEENLQKVNEKIREK
jgi:arylsulfatase A-like enzyme